MSAETKKEWCVWCPTKDVRWYYTTRAEARKHRDEFEGPNCDGKRHVVQYRTVRIQKGPWL